MTSSWYSYQLNAQNSEIRLLCLRSSRNSDAPIQCQIFVTSINEPSPMYTALSYVWGDSMLADEINVEGHAAPKKITYNLSRALRYIRHTSKDTIIWVDAICINQDCLKERSEQVQMMGNIFKKASAVIAWLGEAQDESELGMKSVETLATHLQAFIHTYGSTKEGKGPVNPGILLQRTLQLFPFLSNDQFYKPIFKLAARPYWNRAWIFQELALAKKVLVVCGKNHLSLEYFAEMMSILKCFNCLVKVYLQLTERHCLVGALGSAWQEISNLPMAETLRSLASHRELRPGQPKILHLEILEQLGCRMASDPRDLIFSLYGFLGPDTPFSALLQPDYSKTTEETYLAAARYLILSRGNLDHLNSSMTYASIQGYTNLPSWVPDWRIKRPTQCLYHAVKSHHCHFIDSCVRFSSDGRILFAKGVEIDVIGSTCKEAWPLFHPFSEQDSDSVPFETVRRFLLDGPPVRGESSLSAFLRLQQLNFQSKRRGTSSPAECRSFAISQLNDLYKRFKRLKHPDMTEHSLLMYLIDRYLGDNRTAEDQSRMLLSFLNERMVYGHLSINLGGEKTRYAAFRTVNGSLGFGTEWIAAGDKICQLAAYQPLCILRRYGDTYRNIGPCSILDFESVGLAKEHITSLMEIKIM